MSDDDKLRSALADLETVRRGFSAKVEAMRNKVAAWAGDNAHPPGNDDAAMTDALLVPLHSDYDSLGVSG